MTPSTRRPYRLPDCLRDTDDAERTYQRDITYLSDAELVAERTLAADAYAHAVANRSHAVVGVFEAPGFIPAQDWLQTRVQRLDAEITRRRQARR